MNFKKNIIFHISLICWPWLAQADALSESLIYHTYFGTAQEVQRLLDKGADPNSKDEHGWTALAIATGRNDANALPIATALIAKGADINAAVGRNYPLVNAIINKNGPLVSLLVAHDVSLQILDEKGNSMLQLAKAMGDQDVIYYIDKRLFELEQTKTFLYSGQHLWQIARRYIFENCAFQYWAFYLKSEQDKGKFDEAAMKKRISDHAAKAQQEASFGSHYFKVFQGANAQTLTTSARQMIYEQLNVMISNRNRRENGVGTEKDFDKRCTAITLKLRQNGTDLVLQ